MNRKIQNKENFSSLSFLKGNKREQECELYLIGSSNELSIQYLMEKEVKLVTGLGLGGEKREFFIYTSPSQKLGEGAFGVVYKAAPANDKGRLLAVKIVPYGGDAVKRAKIQSQIDIIRLLPQHPNLVRVLPFKCFSARNFYIFMENCPDGTLADVFRESSILTEDRAANIFYQLISGYRVLFENGILHQDLKLANVLLKGDKLKITDFGFSILTESYIPSLTRQGTLQYMPIEKLTDPNYIADERTDVYALGVMMFELLTKLHPYVNDRAVRTQKDYIAHLRAASVHRPRLINAFSAPIQAMFNLIVSMISKHASNRPSCQEIFAYIDNDLLFAPFRNVLPQKSQYVILQPTAVTVTDKTDTYIIPFPIAPSAEEEYLKQIKEEVQEKQNQEDRIAIAGIQNWVVGLRLSVYYFDRLARRLIVQKLRNPHWSQKKIHSYNRTILCCLLLSQKLTRFALSQTRESSIFSNRHTTLYRSSDNGKFTLRVIRRDQQYIEEEINDNLSKTMQVHVQELNSLVDLAQRTDFSHFINKSKPLLLDTQIMKAACIESRNDLITIVYLIDALTQMNSLPLKPHTVFTEDYFHRLQTESGNILLAKAEKYFEDSDIEYSIDTALKQACEAEEKHQIIQKQIIEKEKKEGYLNEKEEEIKEIKPKVQFDSDEEMEDQIQGRPLQIL